MSGPLSQLIQLEIKLAEWVRGISPRILDANPGEKRNPYLDYGFKWPAYTLAHLYVLEHPENSLRGQEWCAELAMKLVDKSVEMWKHERAQKQGISTGETPHYVTPFVIEKLGDAVDGERKACWVEYEEAWVAQAMIRPQGHTACYHDSWRMTALYRLGHVLDRPDWTKMGLFLFKQMLNLQTKEGFWEDGRHHGPSMRYCGLMLPSLAWMYRWTGDEAFGEAARKLAAFMATWTHPDTMTVGAFDGRNAAIPGFFPTCPGLELVPIGRAFTARAIKFWEDLGVFEDVELAVPSTRDTVRLAFYLADTCNYLLQYAPQTEDFFDTKTPLPIDREGTLEHHSTQFDGILHRSGPWTVALSSQNSDVPKDMKSIYRLDRQSRIELWHEKTSLALGGGHNLFNAAVPLANAILDTGHAGKGSFGRILAEQPFKSIRLYLPRFARTRIVDDTPELSLVFGHGTVTFRIVMEGANSACIDASWDVLNVKRMCLQVPLVVWRDAVLSIDGTDVSDEECEDHVLRREVRANGGPFGSAVSLRCPEGCPSRLHFPLEASHYFDNPMGKDDVRHHFSIALLSCQWDTPPRTGTARFELKVGSQ